MNISRRNFIDLLPAAAALLIIQPNSHGEDSKALKGLNAQIRIGDLTESTIESYKKSPKNPSEVIKVLYDAIASESILTGINLAVILKETSQDCSSIESLSRLAQERAIKDINIYYNNGRLTDPAHRQLVMSAFKTQTTSTSSKANETGKLLATTPVKAQTSK